MAEDINKDDGIDRIGPWPVEIYHPEIKVNELCDWAEVKVYIDEIPEGTIMAALGVLYVNVLFLCEPNCISGLREKAIKNKTLFDYIFTHDEEVLRQCDNAYIFKHGGCSIDLEFYKNSKKFSVSTIVGNKAMSDGHLMRHSLYLRQNEITTPKDFYVSSRGPFNNVFKNKLLFERKEPLFKSMFHITIENSSSKYYFTEKITDCFLAKTIPIYWGCKNIGDYFDTRGFYVANNLDEIIQIANSITEQDYLDKLPFVEENWKNAQQYSNWENDIGNNIRKVINHELPYTMPTFQFKNT